MPEDGPAAEVLNGSGRGPVCLACEHASPHIPAGLDDLGLSPHDRLSHAVWDIGGYELALGLSAALDAPLVASRVSRLVYDCNRPPEAPDAIPEQSETVRVPGNRDLTPAARAARVDQVYTPFQAILTATLDSFAAPPLLVTIHSFSPTWFGTRRETELGLIHDTDVGTAKRLLHLAPDTLNAALNQPYSRFDGVAHTLAVHGTARGLRNVMIEVRNDLVSNTQGVQRMTAVLASMLQSLMSEDAAA